MKKIKRRKLIARTNKKFGKTFAIRKLKENYLSQKANIKCGNRYPDDGKNLFIIIVIEFSFFFRVDTNFISLVQPSLILCIST